MTVENNIPFSPQKDAKPTGVEPQEKEPKLRPQQIRRNLTKLSVIVMILIPSLLGLIYYGLIASNKYATEVRFAVRGGASGAPGSDLLGIFTGVSTAGSLVGDSYILMDYIHSREIIEKLQKKLDLYEIFNATKADYLSAFNPDNPIEDFIEYWRDMVTLNFDTSSQIIVMEVKAFTPEESKKLASQILILSEELINQLSEQARKDSVKFAKLEVGRMETKLQENRKELRQFREKNQEIDPSKTAEAQLSIIAGLNEKLITTRTELRSLKQQGQLDDAPRVKYLTKKILGFEEQIANERSNLGQQKSVKNKSGRNISGLLEEYQLLIVEQEFAQKAYVSALTSLETARIDAARQQRYLATFVLPQTPEDSLYPKRLLNILTILIVSTILWAVSLLVFYSIRDHTVY